MGQQERVWVCFVVFASGQFLPLVVYTYSFCFISVKENQEPGFYPIVAVRIDKEIAKGRIAKRKCASRDSNPGRQNGNLT